MKRSFAMLALNEASRLFDLPSTDLFCGKQWDRAEDAEDAIIYAMWVIGATTVELGQHYGRYDGAAARRRCIRKRVEDKTYNFLVGELVWFLQRGQMAVVAPTMERAA